MPRHYSISFKKGPCLTLLIVLTVTTITLLVTIFPYTAKEKSLFIDNFEDGFTPYTTIIGFPSISTDLSHHGTHSMLVDGNGAQEVCEVNSPAETLYFSSPTLGPTQKFGNNNYSNYYNVTVKPPYSSVDIQAAINDVYANGTYPSNGCGNVLLPAGNFTQQIDFSTIRVNNGYAAFQIASGVNLLGLENQTVLFIPLANWNYSDQDHDQSIAVINGTGNLTSRVSGIIFQGSVNKTDGADDQRTLSGLIEANVNDFQIDHCQFLNFMDSGIKTVGTWANNPSGDSGVISHCKFDNPYRDAWLPHNVSATNYALWGYGIIHVGDYSTWNTNITAYLGTVRPLTVVVEDSEFIRCRHSQAGNGNAFYIDRFNTYSKAFYGACDVHGNAGNGMGGRGIESYNNTFDLTDGSYSQGQNAAYQIRGGGGVICNNTIILDSRYEMTAIIFMNETVAPYDVEQLYIWNNLVKYSHGITINMNQSINNLGNYVENTHYYLTAPNFTYTPLSYPHYLTTGIKSSPSPSPTPSQSVTQSSTSYSISTVFSGIYGALLLVGIAPIVLGILLLLYYNQNPTGETDSNYTVKLIAVMIAVGIIILVATIVISSLSTTPAFIT